MASRRAEEARQFCANMLFNFPLSERESRTLRCANEDVAEPREEEEEEAPPAPRDASDVSEAMRVYEVGARDGSAVLRFAVDNYVHTTYFCNGRTGARCQFSQRALAHDLMDHYVECSHRTFPKVNLRYRGALSHLLYEKSVLVETGSNSAAMSRRMVRETVGLLRTRCGYPHLCIEKRVCRNIVATAKLEVRTDGRASRAKRVPLISLVALKHRFPAAYNHGDAAPPQGKRRRFAGLVVCLADLRSYFAREGEDDVSFEGDVDETAEEAAFVAALNAEVCPPLPSVTAEPAEERSDEELLRETDEYESLALSGKEKGTFLVFAEGQIICTGLKSVRELMQGYTLLFRLLERCLARDPANQSLERSAEKRATL